MEKETLKEAAKKRYIEGVYVINGIDICDASRECFIVGANYQAERMYSEDEVLQMYKDYEAYVIKTPITEVIEFSKWFEQFKKK
jgi:hypothetical protein